MAVIFVQGKRVKIAWCAYYITGMVPTWTKELQPLDVRVSSLFIWSPVIYHDNNFVQYLPTLNFSPLDCKAQ